MNKSLGILLTTSPENENTYTVVRISENAVKLNIETTIFVMCDGTYNMLNKDFLSLLKKGVTIVVCAHNATERGIEKVDGITWGSQYDLANIVNTSDKFLSFT